MFKLLLLEPSSLDEVTKKASKIQFWNLNFKKFLKNGKTILTYDYRRQNCMKKIRPFFNWPQALLLKGTQALNLLQSSTQVSMAVSASESKEGFSQE